MFMYDLAGLIKNVEDSNGFKDFFINTFKFSFGFVMNFATAFIFIGLPVYFGLALFFTGGNP